MNRYRFFVIVQAETEQEAHTVMAERLGCDEDYGFDYTVDWDSEVPGRRNEIWINRGLEEEDE